MARLNRPMILIAATGFGLAACTNPDGSANRTGTGAALGGLLGAATGAIISGDDKKGAVIGGIAGAAIGAGIGNALDRQAQELERDIGASGAQVIRSGNQLIVRMPEAITFATESATVRSSIQDDIFTVARSLQQYPDTAVRVVGHTDNTGTKAFNKGLSERRASAVAALLRQGGVSSGRISTVGRGENVPIASNSSAAGRAANRRVEIVISGN